MPQWEHINAKFDTDYTDLKKSESTNILVIQVFPELKVQKSFYLGKGFSIFTSAVLMALNYICNIQLAIYNFVICVDSKSVLCIEKLEL